MLSVQMHLQNVVRFHQFVLKILSGNEILSLMKGHNFVINLRKLMRTCNDHNLDVFNTNAYAKFVKFHQFVSKILSVNEIRTSIKGLSYKFVKTDV